MEFQDLPLEYVCPLFQKGKMECNRRLENVSESSAFANRQTLELTQAPCSYA